MHEVAIMESAMEAVWQQLHANRARRVHRLVLRVGALSGVDPDALRFAFDVVTANSPAAGAALDVEAIACEAHCPDCAVSFGFDGIAACPQCGRCSSDIRRGRELEVSRIEMS